MCGITGYYNTNGALCSRMTVEKMNSCVHHRGPDSCGIFLSHDWGEVAGETSNVGLGHRRLAILDLSSAGHQPMHSSDGRFTIVFNGEIYNHREIRSTLQSTISDLSFRGHSDTETIVEAFRFWGEKAVEEFIGMFAFSIYDHVEEKLFVFRDRVGIKPLYYYWDGTHFAFASELSALKQFPYNSFEIDRFSLALYLLWGYVPSPHTIIENCYKLEPGCYLEVSKNGLQKIRYWSFAQIVENSLPDLQKPEEQWIDELQELLCDSINKRLLSDVPLGVFLSGGVDSTLTAAIMQSLSRQPIMTFSIGFREKRYDEAPFGRAVASHLGSKHHEKYVSAQDTLLLLREVINYIDEPFADPSILPTTLVAEFAREHVTVALTGDGGDELFFGAYGHYLKYMNLIGYLSLFKLLTHRSTQAALSFTPNLRLRQIALLPQIDSPYMLYSSLITPIRVRHVFRLLGFANDLELERKLMRHDQFASQYIDSNPYSFEALSYYDIQNLLVDQLLTKTDRATMRVALEGRVPLLDHRVVEFAVKLPFYMKYRDGRSKYILRKLLNRYVPESLTERSKQGFSVPISQWLRGQLTPLVRNYLDPERLGREQFFNPQEVHLLVEQHLSGRLDHGRRIWSLLMFQIWQETHLTR